MKSDRSDHPLHRTIDARDTPSGQVPLITTAEPAVVHVHDWDWCSPPLYPVGLRHATYHAEFSVGSMVRNPASFSMFSTVA